MRLARCAVLTLLVYAALGWAQTGPPHLSAHTVNGQQVVLRSNAASIAPSSSVRTLYQLHCMGCHQATGQGEPDGRIPDLRSIGAYLHLPGGREFLVRVPGIAGVGLSDTQVAQLINWLLENKARSWLPAQHQAYTAAEVQDLRRTPLVDVAAERERLVALGQRQGLPLSPVYSASARRH